MANLLVNGHGGDAAMAAAERAGEQLAAADVEGSVVCKPVLATIGEFARTTSAEGERVN